MTFKGLGMPNPYGLARDFCRRGEACDHARKVRVYGQEASPNDSRILFSDSSLGTTIIVSWIPNIITHFSNR